MTYAGKQDFSVLFQLVWQRKTHDHFQGHTLIRAIFLHPVNCCLIRRPLHTMLSNPSGGMFNC